MPCCKAEEYNGWCKNLSPKKIEDKAYCVFHASKEHKSLTPESYNIIRECLSTLINPRPMFKVNTKSRNMFSTEVSAKKFIKIKTDSRKEDI